jgi:DNA-binding transcriptional regulator YdaS (Cro superfamily)
MKLAIYLARKGISQKEFAKRAGLSTGTVSLLVRGRVWISREAALAIAQATKGKVTANDFVVREAAE